MDLENESRTEGRKAITERLSVDEVRVQSEQRGLRSSLYRSPRLDFYPPAPHLLLRLDFTIAVQSRRWHGELTQALASWSVE